LIAIYIPTLRAIFADHVREKSPQWASRITGCDVATIEAFAQLVGATKRAYFRLGYGFARSRNGAANMHAASCIPAVTGGLVARRRRRLPHQWPTSITGTSR